jgi:hypothetical protein
MIRYEVNLQKNYFHNLTTDKENFKCHSQENPNNKFNKGL